MPAGRPNEYSEDMPERVEQYIIICQDEDNPRLPTKEGLALYLNISRDTVYDWASKYPEFSYTLDKVMAYQGDELQQGGLTNRYNPTIAKLMLSSNHGMRERSDVTTNDKDLPTPIANVHRDYGISEDK